MFKMTEEELRTFLTVQEVEYFNNGNPFRAWAALEVCLYHGHPIPSWVGEYLLVVSNALIRGGQVEYSKLRDGLGVDANGVDSPAYLKRALGISDMRQRSELLMDMKVTCAVLMVKIAMKTKCITRENAAEEVASVFAISKSKLDKAYYRNERSCYQLDAEVLIRDIGRSVLCIYSQLTTVEGRDDSVELRRLVANTLGFSLERLNSVLASALDAFAKRPRLK
ncbi:hypothetical protein [Desulfocurvibacter africanus]|uniref:hypothetical protein n=1 Tax=Desulfocurvibacter africanus TaxID=873 RepID=UPI00110C6F57|nr:hypothetical protein [Desulfocurvibacter africanus]